MWAEPRAVVRQRRRASCPSNCYHTGHSAPFIAARSAAMNGGAGSLGERVSGQQFPAIRENSKIGRENCCRWQSKPRFFKHSRRLLGNIAHAGAGKIRRLSRDLNRAFREICRHCRLLQAPARLASHGGGNRRTLLRQHRQWRHCCAAVYAANITYSPSRAKHRRGRARRADTNKPDFSFRSGSSRSGSFDRRSSNSDR